jgi:hypothetical protein
MTVGTLSRFISLLTLGSFFEQGMRGMNDDKHFNYWEDWFRRAYKVEEFSAFNTLWLTYFIAGGLVSGDH